jgi:hypothetical protein
MEVDMKKFLILVILFTMCACSAEDSTPFDGNEIADQTTTDNENQDKSNDDQLDIVVDNETDDLVDKDTVDDEDMVDDNDWIFESNKKVSYE